MNVWSRYFLVFLMTCLAGSASGQTGSMSAPVLISSRCSYQGMSEAMYEGHYKNVDLGFANIQSMQVAPGYAVVVERMRHNGHQSVTQHEEYRSSQSCFKWLWGTNIRSIYIYRIREPQIAAPVAPQPSFDLGASVYSGKNFQGSFQQLYPGVYRESKLMELGLTTVFSIQVHPGNRVVMFSGPDLNGASNVINSSFTDLQTILQGNRIRSLIVEQVNQPVSPAVNIQANHTKPVPVATPSDAISLFSAAQYQGAQQVLTPGNYRNYELGLVGDRNTSSIAIPSGFRVIVFSGPNFNGVSRVLERSVPDLVSENKGWNNVISSIIVEKTR